MNRLRERFKRLGTALGIAFVVATVVQLLLWASGYFTGEELLARSGATTFALVALSCFIVGLVVVLFRTPKTDVAISYTKGDIDDQSAEDSAVWSASILSEIREAYEQERWNEVLRIGRVLSRPLWVAGSYTTRLRIGEWVEHAASCIGNKFAQAAALIDDLGWTNHIVGKSERAIKNIRHGIAVATEAGAIDIVVKGYRHLAGIYRDSRDYNSAVEAQTQAEDMVKQLPSSGVKDDLVAGLWVSRAMLYLEQEQWAEAHKLLKDASQSYESREDWDREVKIYSLEGQALLGVGKIGSAKDSYRKGLGRAKELSRPDEVVKCSLGLASALFQEDGATATARQFAEGALAIATKRGMASLEREATELLTKLGGRR